MKKIYGIISLFLLLTSLVLTIRYEVITRHYTRFYATTHFVKDWIIPVLVFIVFIFFFLKSRN